MKLKKFIIFCILMLLPYSCATLNLSNEYPINSVWIFHYNSKKDSTIVYIDHISIIDGIVIRDTKIRNDTTIFGRVNKVFLYPVVIQD